MRARAWILLLVLLVLLTLLAACGGGDSGEADGGSGAADSGGVAPDSGASDGAGGGDAGGGPVAARLSISGEAPPATAGSPYVFTPLATGGEPPYRWSAAIISPDGQGNGLQLDTSTGAISGTPLFSGQLPLLLEASDSAGRRASAQLLLSVGGAGAGKSLSNAPPGALQGAPYSFTFTAPWSGILGCAVGLFQVWGKVPPGLSLDPLGGVLSGTPLTAGRFTFGFYADPATVSCSQSEPTQTNVTTFSVDVAPAAAPAALPGASNWRVAAAPVLQPTPGAWDSDHLGAPALLKVQGTYYLFYDGQGGPAHRRQIGLATASDGSAFSKVGSAPVLAAGAAGAWDEMEVLLPSVHHDGTQFRLWYLGRASADDGGAVGLATSADGRGWTRHPQPVFGAAGGVGAGTAPGQVLLSDGTFTLYYVDSRGEFGRATSGNGSDWVDAGPLSYDFSPSHPFTRPTVIADGATLRMWYMRRGDSIANQALGSTTPHGIGGQVFDDWTANAIAHATSTDGGASWSLYEGNPVLVAGGAWDGAGVAYPTVLVEESRFRMWFAAGAVRDGSARGVIGEAAIP